MLFVRYNNTEINFFSIGVDLLLINKVGYKLVISSLFIVFFSAILEVSGVIITSKINASY